MKKFFREFLRGRFLGHPIHIMLVHFPITLLPMVLILDISSVYFKEQYLALFSFYTLCAAAITGWAAIIFGSIDLFKIPPKEKAFRIALIHGGLNFIWISAFSVLAGIGLKNYPDIDLPSAWKIIGESFVAAGMLYSNFLGGELLLKHDIGKKRLKEN